MAASLRYMAQCYHGVAGVAMPALIAAITDIVLGVDPRHGGDLALAELEDRRGALPTTWRFLIGGGEWLAQAPLETIVARVPAERRDDLGWTLVRLAALPKPKKKKPGKSVPGVDRRRKTTDEQRRDVIRLRTLGVQYKEIARLTKVNRGTAQSIVKLGR